YRWLTNIKETYTAALAQDDVNYQAIALTLNAWMYANVTDAFGDIPMEEATRGDEGIFRPKFNTQQEVYTKLISSLDSANKLFNTTLPMKFGTEILYANNVGKWKKFCNSLRMRLLLRVSKRSEMNSLAELNRMISNPTIYPVFTSNTEGAVLSLTGISPYMSPWGRAIDFTTFRAAGEFFVNNLNNFNDPRLPKFCTEARPVSGTGTLGYKGIPSGYDGNGATFNFIPSNMNIALVTAPMNIPIMPYAEVEFIKAEVALLSSNAAATKTAYEKGVKASIEQWGAVMPATYFTNPLAAFDGTMERIMLQKYYALFFVDYQQWFERRRTGLPVLPVGPGMLNNQQLPSRYYYPVAIRSTNTTNYQQAVQIMGGDDVNVKVWWQR
ncbi:MAG TPA: SusD/RagB family nutrient-binding outer membrane lipoprotein, partial [Ferruginibacter sp.]|nr:SusD/RagB family nutrient-binding outer membrane lipoprotein [Ferruginibacter sp.]